MSDTPSRMFGLVCLLILLWVGVYWLYQPRASRTMAAPNQGPTLTTVDPRPPVPVVDPNPPRPVPAPIVSPPRVREPEPQPQGPRERVIPPQFRQIVVRHGDVSFEVVAARELGDRRKWQVIARANPWVTSDRLKPGKTVLNIPLDPANIQGKVVVENGSATPTSLPASTPTMDVTYVVQPEDTLWDIARKVYKRGGAWRTIYEANRDVIKNPDRPPAGAVLKIPPAPPRD